MLFASPLTIKFAMRCIGYTIAVRMMKAMLLIIPLSIAWAMVLTIQLTIPLKLQLDTLSNKLHGLLDII